MMENKEEKIDYTLRNKTEAKSRLSAEKRIFNELFPHDSEEILKLKYDKAIEFDLYVYANYIREKIKNNKHKKNN